MDAHCTSNYSCLKIPNIRSDLHHLRSISALKPSAIVFQPLLSVQVMVLTLAKAASVS